MTDETIFLYKAIPVQIGYILNYRGKGQAQTVNNILSGQTAFPVEKPINFYPIEFLYVQIKPPAEFLAHCL
jgi:hypothetical protein